MTKKKKVLNWWATRMLNPKTRNDPEYVAVCAPSIKALERFYCAILDSDSQPFKRKGCQKVRITKRP